MLSRTVPILEKLAAHSALFALLYMACCELAGLLLRLLPAAVRPARAFAQSDGAYDLDDRRVWGCEHPNRRVAGRDRRRHLAFAPRGLNGFSRSDRRVMARGRRTSDWGYS